MYVASISLPDIGSSRPSGSLSLWVSLPLPLCVPVNSVLLCYGEPFAHPQYWHTQAMASKLNIHTSISLKKKDLWYVSLKTRLEVQRDTFVKMISSPPYGIFSQPPSYGYEKSTLVFKEWSAMFYCNFNRQIIVSSVQLTMNLAFSHNRGFTLLKVNN